MTVERRVYTLQEFRMDVNGDKKPMIVGHAAVFNLLSDNLGGFREKILPGAFTKAIQEDDVRALFNHNPDHVLGRNKSGTLRLMEDKTGLRVEIDPPDTQVGRDLQVSMSRGDINQMSFGFRVMPGDAEWSEDAAGLAIRTIKKASLFDVSPVTYPAYPQTDCALRDLTGWKSQQNELSKGYDDTLKAYLRAQQLRIWV